MRRLAPDKLARNLLARFRRLAGVFGADAFALKFVEGMGPDEVVDVTLLREEAVRIDRAGWMPLSNTARAGTPERRTRSASTTSAPWAA
jgi:DNA repair protein RadC